MATDVNIIIKQSKYAETRKRVSKFKNMFDISDKEIIEYLAEEIEQDRDRIRKQEEYIKELHNKQRMVKAIYKADILEYENGKIDILYECDKEKNKQCNKTNCSIDCCTHTLDKQYAKNYKENKTHEIDSNRNIYCCGIDGQGKDYAVTSYYDNGELIKEEIRPCE